MISGPWNLGFLDSRSALELASFDWFPNFGILEWNIENLVQGQVLSGKTTLYIEIGKNKPYPGNSRISGCLDSRFEKSRDAPKSAHNHSIKLNLHQMCQIKQIIGHFQRNSRVWDNSWKIPRMMEFLNSALKILF